MTSIATSIAMVEHTSIVLPIATLRLVRNELRRAFDLLGVGDAEAKCGVGIAIDRLATLLDTPVGSLAEMDAIIRGLTDAADVTMARAIRGALFDAVEGLEAVREAWVTGGECTA
jgi:hypothetical protein